MRYNTMNPVEPSGSSDPRDLYDNAPNIDLFANGSAHAYPDRRGVSRLSLAGIEASFAAAQATRDAEFREDQSRRKAEFAQFIESSGYFKGGDFAPGLVIRSHNQYVEVSGLAYVLLPSIAVPYTVTGSWGVESVNFKLAGDDALRQQLAPIVDHFGADPTGATDSTAAFIAAGDGAYVPSGEYSVDASLIDVTKYSGPGTLLHKGNRIFLGKKVFEGRAAQRLGGSPLLGWEASGPNAQLYSGAGNATQGLAWVKVAGVEKLFITQRVSGSGPTEMCRISEWNWSGNGADMTCVAFTEPLSIGHGSGLTAFVEGTELYLYTTWHNTGTIGGGASNQGKGFSKVKWKGAATAQSDVQGFRVFGDPTDTDGVTRLTWPQSASTCVTLDGKYVVLITTSFTGTGRFFFVYDRAEVEAVGPDARAVRPAFGPVPIERAPGEFGATCQGLASDGRNVYTIWGLGAARALRTIQVYDMFGRLQHVLPYTGAASLYTENELLGLGSRGIPVSFEPEGICIRGNELLSLSIDAWKAPQDVVTASGKNWASINTNATAGKEPSNRSNWVETKLPANLAYSPLTAYIAGAYTFRQKRVMRIGLAAGGAGERSMQRGSNDASTGTIKDYYSGTDIAFNAENGSFTLAKFYEALGTYKKCLELNFDNNFNFFSTTEGEPNDRWVTIKSNWGSSSRGMELRSSGGNTAEGAWINLNANDSPGGPGEAIIGSTGSAAVRLRNGSITAATFTPTDISLFATTAVRPVTDGLVTNGGVGRNWLSTHSMQYCVAVSSCTITTSTGSPEGIVTAGPGSIHLRRSGGAGTAIYIKESGTGNTGWVGK